MPLNHQFTHITPYATFVAFNCPNTSPYTSGDRERNQRKFQSGVPTSSCR